ncbi:MAG TPA: hypothetical protein VHB79_33990 [Polyangiaceae bacterium]|nr:hypothetical protein [Polyangiaceae bacterium]
MKSWALGSFGIAIALVLLSAHASAQGDEPAEGAKPAADKPADGKAGVSAKGSAKADEDEEEEEDAPAAKPAAAASASGEVQMTAPSAEAPPAPESGLAATRAPVYGKRGDWNITPYGYARFDAIEDSTQSFEDGIQPNLIQRVGTYRGDHRRTIFTARDSRIGLFVGAPPLGSIRTSGQIEFDFYGLAPTDARRHDTVVFGPLRIRHAYLKLETPAIDVIAGQYFDLFGWNGSFYPATVGYMGVPAQLYHRNPQLRLQKDIGSADGFQLSIAAAAVRPGQRDSGVPDVQGGIKIAIGQWSGAAMSGFGRPAKTPLSIGLSGVYRRFEVPAFRAEPGSEAVKASGYGFAAQILAPIVPIKDIEDHGNALTLTGEFSTGTGIADMYTFMDGGSRFPLLPNPGNASPAVIYQANVDPGLVTFDRTFALKTIQWTGFVGGLQYYFPIGGGKLWVSAIYSQIKSNNIKKLTPYPSWGGIFTKMEYFDANLGYDITPAVCAGVSFQTVKQTFGDVSSDTPIYGTTGGTGNTAPLAVAGTGGVAATARNNRLQFSMAFFF